MARQEYIRLETVVPSHTLTSQFDRFPNGYLETLMEVDPHRPTLSGYLWAAAAEAELNQRGTPVRKGKLLGYFYTDTDSFLLTTRPGSHYKTWVEVVQLHMTKRYDETAALVGQLTDGTYNLWDNPIRVDMPEGIEPNRVTDGHMRVVASLISGRPFIVYQPADGSLDD